jgi:hypothetical protein
MLSRTGVRGSLEIGRTRSYALLNGCRPDPEDFEITDNRRSPGRLTPATEAEIRRELLRK